MFVAVKYLGYSNDVKIIVVIRQVIVGAGLYLGLLLVMRDKFIYDTLRVIKGKM